MTTATAPIRRRIAMLEPRVPKRDEWMSGFISRVEAFKKSLNPAALYGQEWCELIKYVDEERTRRKAWRPPFTAGEVALLRRYRQYGSEPDLDVIADKIEAHLKGEA